MKPSIYNSVISVAGEHTLVYNAMTGKFVAIKKRIMTSDDLKPDMLSESNPTLYDQLVDSGAFVDDAIDEPALVREEIRKADNNTDEYILHVNPTLDCNFRCWYCYENHLNGSRMSSDTLEAVKRFIARTVGSNPSIKRFSLGFFGGEPLMYFAKIARPLIEAADKVCKDNGVSLHVNFTTNAGLLTDSMTEFLKNYACGFQITLDGGEADHDKTRFWKNGSGSYRLIINNVKKLARNGMNVILRINFTSENIDSASTVADFFSDLDEKSRRYISVDLQRVWQDRKDRFDETEEKAAALRAELRKEGFTVHTNHLAHTVRQSCYGDKVNHILINYNGDLYGCTARDFNRDNRIGTLSPDGETVFEEEKHFLRENAKYSKEFCYFCRIAPICGGGCKQRAVESCDPNGCHLGHTDRDKDKMILDIFEHSFCRER